MTETPYIKVVLVAKALAEADEHTPVDPRFAEGWHAAIASVRQRIMDLESLNDPAGFDRKYFYDASRRKRAT